MAESPSPLPHVYMVTKYDPADWDEHGRYVGPEDERSDHGPVEAAYLSAIAAFAEDSGVRHLTIREPELPTGFVNFGLEPPIDGFGLTGLFPPDLSGYHDGAQVSIRIGLELVRAMLRDNGAWCLLEAEQRFFVHVGYDQYVYVGSTEPCDRAVSLAHANGLFATRIDDSPHNPIDDDDVDEPCPADEAFWSDLAALVASRGAVILEEGYVQNVSRWHRLTSDAIAAVRAGLTPRARLLVWPDLSTDVTTVLAGLPAEGLSEIVWQDEHGHISNLFVNETAHAALPSVLAGARAAMVLSIYADESNPLLSGVLPDPDGVLRARWAP